MSVIDRVRRWCLAFPGATEDIKWDDNLVFSVGERMFAITTLDPPHRVSFKCGPEAFAELVERDGIAPAPYLARARWVSVDLEADPMDDIELRARLAEAYETIVAKLPGKARARLAGHARARGRQRSSA